MNIREIRGLPSTVCVCIGILLAGPLRAQAGPGPASPPVEQSNNGWRFTFAPYLFSPTLGGTGTIGNAFPSVKVNMTASEVFSHPQMGNALYFEAGKGPWSFALDGIFVNRTQPISAEYDFTGIVCTPFGGGGAICGAGPDSSRVTGSIAVTQRVVEGFVLRHIAKSFELVVGAIGTRVQGNISAIVPGYGAGSPDFYTMPMMVKGNQETWGDPVVGARWTPVDGEHWRALIFGDIGGVSSNNRTWQVLPSLGYRFVNVFELQLQYRALATNYATGSGKNTFRYDVSLTGPQLGVALHL